MAFWCVLIILLGLWGVIRDILALNIPELLNPAANIAIILVALGLLIRTRVKQKAGTLEKLRNRISELEAELENRQFGV